MISGDKVEKYEQETLQIKVDFELPSTDCRADNWWYSLEKKHPKLTKLAIALSIFHGPHIENYFCLMSEITDKKSNRMEVETYSVTPQSVHYGLSSRATGNMKCATVFRRQNKVSFPVMPRLLFNISNDCMFLSCHVATFRVNPHSIVA